MEKPKTELSVFVQIDKFRVLCTADEGRKSNIPGCWLLRINFGTNYSILRADYDFLLTVALIYDENFSKWSH